MFESRRSKLFRAYCSGKTQGIKMIKAKIEFAQTKSNKTILILVIKELQYIDVDWKYIKTVYNEL